MEKERYSLVDVFDNPIWTASCPVDICQGALIYDSLVGQHCLQLQMTNTGAKPLVSVYVDVFCYDESGNLLLGEPINLIYRELNVPQHESFGEGETFYLRSGRVRSVSCHVVRVMYLSGEIWKAQGSPARISAQSFESLDADLRQIFFARLRESYFAGVQTEFKVVAYRDSAFWVCTCGKGNDNAQETCQRCGMNRDWILQNLNEETLLAARALQQEKSFAETATQELPQGAPGAEDSREGIMDVPGATGRYVPVREKPILPDPAPVAPFEPEVVAAQKPLVTAMPAVDSEELPEDSEDEQDALQGASLGIKIALGIASVLLLVTIGGIIWFFINN